MIRPCNFYGPGLRLDDQRIVPDLMNTVLNREPITLFSDGKPTRTFCYISDAINAMLRIAGYSPACRHRLQCRQ